MILITNIENHVIVARAMAGKIYVPHGFADGFGDVVVFAKSMKFNGVN